MPVGTGGSPRWGAPPHSSVPGHSDSKESPPIIGVQEAFRFLHFTPLGVPLSAPIDLLAELEAELRDRDLDYVTVAVQNDRTTPNNLWPSDHSGLVVGLRLPSGLLGGQ